MNTTLFTSLSNRGRVAYVIFCIENYALSYKPAADWQHLFEKIWEVLSEVYWDEWAYEFMEMIPEYLTEFPSYASSNFDYLSESLYNELIALYKGMPREWNAILHNLYEIVLELGYSCSDSEGHAQNLIKEIEQILQTENISLPIEKLTGLFPSSERNGYGNPFDGRKISHILNQENADKS